MKKVTNLIGINNKVKGYQYILIAIFVIVTALTIIFLVLYSNDYKLGKLYDNGIEVEAEIIDVDYEDVTTESDSATYTWYCIYLYISPEGNRYYGSCGPSGSKKYVESFIGKKVPIIIDPNGTDSMYGTLDGIARFKDDINIDFTLACIFTGLFCIVSYFLIYRVIYRMALDKKILKRLEGRFVNDCVSQGEVTKTRKWIVGYVKVKYRDEIGENQEKWARSWFTRKETKFLEKKKYINIVPYKNTYGIVEEMS